MKDEDKRFYLTLKEFFDDSTLTIDVRCHDGVLGNPTYFPLRGIEVQGAVLFADLPGFSTYAAGATAAECAYVSNHFFTWMSNVGVIGTGGILANFIGDAILVVYIDSVTEGFSKELALFSAQQMLDLDAFAFEPRIGIAYGSFIVAETGTDQFTTVSAIGHPVNLASRCVSSAPYRKCIRIAEFDSKVIDKIFYSEDWKIEEPKVIQFKNIPSTSVVDVRLSHQSTPEFDYFATVSRVVKEARKAKDTGSR